MNNGKDMKGPVVLLYWHTSMSYCSKTVREMLQLRKSRFQHSHLVTSPKQSRTDGNNKTPRRDGVLNIAFLLALVVVLSSALFIACIMIKYSESGIHEAARLSSNAAAVCMLDEINGPV